MFLRKYLEKENDILKACPYSNSGNKLVIENIEYTTAELERLNWLFTSESSTQSGSSNQKSLPLVCETEICSVGDLESPLGSPTALTGMDLRSKPKPNLRSTALIKDTCFDDVWDDIGNRILATKSNINLKWNQNQGQQIPRFQILVIPIAVVIVIHKEDSLFDDTQYFRDTKYNRNGTKFYSCTSLGK
ncbi:Period protein 2/3C-terminal region [Popillia japonica]|uniref:Period protein 2/3C-terminal region n=1 Tax=Popillia japonica TaxID=7064 RepID=A0AAW1LRR0_POPJA